MPSDSVNSTALLPYPLPTPPSWGEGIDRGFGGIKMRPEDGSWTNVVSYAVTGTNSQGGMETRYYLAGGWTDVNIWNKDNPTQLLQGLTCNNIFYIQDQWAYALTLNDGGPGLDGTAGEVTTLRKLNNGDLIITGKFNWAGGYDHANRTTGGNCDHCDSCGLAFTRIGSSQRIRTADILPEQYEATALAMHVYLGDNDDVFPLARFFATAQSPDNWIDWLSLRPTGGPPPPPDKVNLARCLRHDVIGRTFMGSEPCQTSQQPK